jgi:hypothetical protein
MAAKRKDRRGAKGRRAPASTSWVLGRRTAPFLVESPERHRPELLVLIDVGTSRMVALEAVSPGQTAEAVAAWAGPRVESGVTLRVDSEELASALRARLDARAAAARRARHGECPSVGDLWRTGGGPSHPRRTGFGCSDFG